MVAFYFTKRSSGYYLSWGLLWVFASVPPAEGADHTTEIVATDISQRRLSPEELADIIRQHMEPDDFLRLTRSLSDEPQADEFAQGLDAIRTIYQDESHSEMGTGPETGRSAQSGFDPSTVRRGQGLFQSHCTICHDAERATSKRKGYAAWLATVRRMAAKDDADIPASTHVPIATYLASLNPAASGDSSSTEASAEALPFSLNGTLSPVWRGTDPSVENPGFFVDAWIGIDWRPPQSPISGRVTACTSCHGTNNGLGVELVEASVTLDLMHCWTGCPQEKRSSDLELKLQGGRFIIPFGAFSAVSHPGALRTVSVPLMFNMGRRVGSVFPLQPVLLMPAADEGFRLHLSKALTSNVTATFDVYGVNGLQAGGSSVFFFSRSYRDNNSQVAVGGRASVGNSRLKFGGSIVSGEQQSTGSPQQNYKLAGGDVTFRYEDLLRVYYEYAIREEDSSPGARSLVYGNVVEAELRLLDYPQINLLARYDTLDHRGALGENTTERITAGINWTLRGGSLVIVNYEHWQFDDLENENIMGLRWTTAF